MFIILHQESKAERQSSPLLRLAPELRNRIYEFAAIEDDQPIKVQPSLRQPPFLATCHQIRDEALGIWYEANEFEVTVKDCDAASLLNPWIGHCCDVGQQNANITMSIQGQLDWPKIVSWCHAIATGGRSRRLLMGDDMNRHEEVVAKAHEVAERFRGRSWKGCLKALEYVREHQWGIIYDTADDSAYL